MVEFMDPLGDPPQHQCPLCSKLFARRDLRERHRRRCQKSTGKQKPTKKTACESCIASKVKCDHKKPACSRCIARSMQCEYKLEPYPPREPSAPRAEISMINKIPDASAGAAGDMDMLLLNLMNSLPETEYTFPAQVGMPHDLQISQHRSQSWEPDPNNTIWSTSNQQAPFTIPYTLVDPVPLNGRWSQLPDLSAENLQLQQSHDGHGRTGSIATVSSAEAQHRLSHDYTQQLHDLSPSGNVVLPPIHGSVASSHSEDNSTPGALSQQSVQSPDTRTCSSLSEPLSLGYRSRSIAKHSDSLSDAARTALSSHKALPPGSISVGDAIKMMTEYPTRMLVDTFQSPFVHPKLNRESPRGMPEPIAVAMACVGMKMHAERSGLPFVCTIFRDQREKLIKALPSLGDNYEEIAAALHAMCIYQIEGLLSENSYDSKLLPLPAVLHQEYLVRMTRRLIDKLDDGLPEFFSSPSTANVGWESWAVYESLRRVLFLLMIIHQLLGATNILEPAFFEPMFSESVSDKLLLPCADILWHANSEAEWDEARQSVDDDQCVHLGEAVRRFRDAKSNVGPRKSSEDGDRNDILHDFGQLPEITKLIISVAQIAVKEL